MTEWIVLLWLLAGVCAFSIITIPARETLKTEPPDGIILIFLLCEIFGPVALVFVLAIVLHILVQGRGRVS